jgi:NADPH2:quinone reductase
MSESMRAVVVQQPGGPEALTLVERPVPEAASGEVVVAVEAVGMNPVDCGNRADPSWAGVEAPYVVGYEFAGRVSAVGPGAYLAIGDDVWGLLPVQGTRWGALAEKIAVPADLVALRPPRLDAVAAAALPLAGCTALQVLDRLGLPPGAWLLVHGAAGGVGHLLVQMASRRGLHVAAASRPDDRARLEALGVDLWLDRSVTDPAAAAGHALGHELDAVVDLVGGLLEPSLPHVRVGGRVATIVDLAGDLELAIDRNLDVHGVLMRAGRDRLDALAGEVAAGVRPTVVATYSLAQAADAHRRLEAGGVGGKLVITVT